MKKDGGMRNVPPDKYNVAWFKLAECVSRGEKERALGVYRLLAYSLQDSAFARQLQGDIFIAFNDPAGALDHYRAAAELYQKDGRFIEAAAIYEHLLTLSPGNRDYRMKLVTLYASACSTSKLLSHVQVVYAELINEQEHDTALRLIDGCEGALSSGEICMLWQNALMLLLNKKPISLMHIMQLGKKIVASLLSVNDVAGLQRFLAAVETCDSHCYAQLHALIHDPSILRVRPQE
jgi:tetratricopeptide (TPR) repeat protein